MRSEETSRSIVYRLASPTNWAEVEKVLGRIREEMASRRTYDDDVTVVAGDDSILFTFAAGLAGGARGEMPMNPDLIIGSETRC